MLRLDKIEIVQEVDERIYITGIEGDTAYFGITAKATISRSIGNGERRLHWIDSAGLWGLFRSDHQGDLYNKDMAGEQIDDLKDELAAFGVDLSNFDELAASALEAM